MQTMFHIFSNIKLYEYVYVTSDVAFALNLCYNNKLD